MTVLVAPDWMDAFDLIARRPPEFYSSAQQIVREAPASQAHALYRAWTTLGLNGVLYVAGQPTVFFKEVEEIDPQEMRELCNTLWNHGVAPVLIVISPSKVQVYSSLTLPPKRRERATSQNRLVEELDRVSQALEVRQLTRQIELGEFFGKHEKSFNPKRRVDRYLLDNLDAARELLDGAGAEPLGPTTVLALLGRTVFTCYLVDRKIIGESYFRSVGADGVATLAELFGAYGPEQTADLLYELFKQLKHDFNGDLFQGDLDAERARITAAHIDVLRRFLNGDKLRTGQASLGFWPYDFGIIPIETISAIYESFLEVEDASEKRAIGAYYTPRFLAEIVLDTALEGWTTILDKRFLDPACGSGIFLVGLFNRMAVEWRRRYPEADNQQHATALIEMLRANLFGVDASETACRIAAFSLYLALLDQLEPRDIQELQRKGRVLPTLVLGKNQQPGDPDAGVNILCRDFFIERLPLPSAQFDLVVGNPPWVKAPASQMLEWCERHGDLAIAQDQLSHGFLWKAPTHVHDGARGCFLVPAGILLNHQSRALAFQHDWLCSVGVDRIINLADLSSFLFEHAARPALVIRFAKIEPEVAATTIDYVVPKADEEALHAELLSISPDDRVRVRLREVIGDLRRGDPPLIWKETLWGTPRDIRFLNRLRDYPQLGDLTRETDGSDGRWLFGEGFNTLGKGEARERPILREIPFLPSGSVDRYVVTRASAQATPRSYTPRYLGKEAIYRAPHVLFPHGVPRTGERIKVAYCSFDCSFEHSIRGIHGPPEDEDLLRFLTCTLASPVALYFFFHTVANWGSERAKIHVAEYERFPFPLPRTPDQKDILRKVADLHRVIEQRLEEDPVFASYDLEQYQSDIDELIYTYYDIDAWEAALIENTVKVSIPSATPSRGKKYIPTLDPSTDAQRANYVQALIGTLNEWAARGPYQIEARLIISSRAGAGVVILERVTGLAQLHQEEESVATVDAAIGRIRRALPETSGSISYLRDLKILLDDGLYILKPLSRRFWTTTSALNDADEIAAAILARVRGK